MNISFAVNKIFYLFFLAVIFCSCTGKPKTATEKLTQISTESPKEYYDYYEYVYDNDIPISDSVYEEQEEYRETRLRFPKFTIVIHNFKGYDTYGEFGNRSYGGDFDVSRREGEAYLNDKVDSLDIINDNYIETLIVVKDSIHLSESLFDNRINGKLIQIIPNNQNDRFEISFCYLKDLVEMFDYKKLSWEQFDELYSKRFHKQESTEFIKLKDSLNFYFRTFDTSDENKYAEFLRFHEKDFERIKQKYGFRDTLIEFRGEGGTAYATLTKNNKIFGYDADAELFRIKRYSGNKLKETKYIIVYYAYGC